MKLLRELSDESLFDAQDVSILDYKIRIAARCIVIIKNKIALLHATRLKFYKLPGGGLEGDETIAQCLYREVLEETGCEIEVMKENGLINEYRAKHKLLQVSLCFTGRVINEPGEPSYTKDERNDGFELLWVEPEEALKLIKENNQNIYEQKFMTQRDATFLNNYIHNS